VFLLASMLQTHGQSYIVTNYTSRDGLGHDFVRVITADSSGFVWMATWDGLTRYDGTDFVTYYHDPADSTSIPYFSVNNVVIDAHDNLWGSTDDAKVFMLDRSSGRFRVIRMAGKNSLANLVCFKAGPDGFLWFVLREGILRYVAETGESSLYPWSGADAIMKKLIFSQYDLVFEGDEHLWLAGSDVVEIILTPDTATGKIVAAVRGINGIERLPGRTGLFFINNARYQIAQDSIGYRWLASTTGLFRHDSEQEVFREYRGNYTDLTFSDTIPVAFYNPDRGLMVWLPDRKEMLTISTETCGLPTGFFFYDRNMLWFSHQSAGQTASGVTKVVFTPFEFRHINPLPVKNNMLNIFGIVTDSKGALWLAARDREYIIRIHNDGSAEQFNRLSETDLERYWHARSFLRDENGLWIGYYGSKLIYYDLETESITEHHPDVVYAHTTCFDENRKILIADGGIKRYDPLSGKTETLLALGDTINIFILHRDGNILWAGCNYSYLLRYDLKTGKNKSIRILKGITNIEDICTGDDGKLWLATLGTGVCRYDPVTDEKHFFTTSSGLSNNTTYSILKDRKGNIWVSTNHGISVINPESGLIRAFSENDGLKIHEFNSDAGWMTDDGRFIFGGVGGAVEFDPEQLLGNQVIAHQNLIIIKELEVSARRKILDRPVYKADTVILDKGENNFHISFVTPDYRDPEKMRYRYRIDAEPETWYYTDHSDRNINFSNMQPGWYTLEIQSTDTEGMWGNSRILTLFLKPRFYQTLLFRITFPLAILLVLGLISFLFFNYYKNREQHKRDMLHHQALRGQMNPHFIFNALNSINYFISNNDRLSANRYISDFSKLIRNVLNNMNEDYVKLDVELGSLEEYLKIEHLRFGDKFDYTMKIDPLMNQDSLMVSPGLIQPFVENAIWHGVMGLEGRKGKITISLKMKENSILCTVDDDGIGRVRSEALKDKSLPSKPKGISLAMERLRIINNLRSVNYRIRISDLHPDLHDTGTRVEIDIPVMT
jgi:ligand-binding sensor domain-containing protein